MYLDIHTGVCCVVSVCVHCLTRRFSLAFYNTRICLNLCVATFSNIYSFIRVVQRGLTGTLHAKNKDV